MALLGIDFDNTLVRYDKLFYNLALEKGLIEADVPASKTAIRDLLRSEGKDEQEQHLEQLLHIPARAGACPLS